MISEIPNWEPAQKPADEVDIPGEVEGCWINTETRTQIAVKFCPRKEKWLVTGENSVIKEATTVEEAKQKAREYMVKTPRPSPMV